jgi:hypothetical protein
MACIWLILWMYVSDHYSRATPYAGYPCFSSCQTQTARHIPPSRWLTGRYCCQIEEPVQQGYLDLMERGGCEPSGRNLKPESSAMVLWIGFRELTGGTAVECTTGGMAIGWEILQPCLLSMHFQTRPNENGHIPCRAVQWCEETLQSFNNDVQTKALTRVTLKSIGCCRVQGTIKPWVREHGTMLTFNNSCVG